jgi:transcription elongation factor GreA-like protein
MKLIDFKKGQKVKHNLRQDWGIGEVVAVFNDRSILVHFPDKTQTHPDNINKFRYYEPGFNEFKQV